MRSPPAGLTPSPEWHLPPREADVADWPEPAAAGLLDGLAHAAALRPAALA